MGMNHKGEIALLAGLTHPDVGVYTNIGPVHIEFFGTVEKIAEAKRELLENVKPGGTIVVNNDDEHVVRISEGFPGTKVTYGIDHDAMFRAENLRERGLLGTSFTMKGFPMELALPGRHNVENFLAAVATARAVGIGVGKRSRALLDGAKQAGFADDRLHHFDDAAGAAEFLKSFIKDGDLVLIKASRGIGLDRIVTQLEGAH